MTWPLHLPLVDDLANMGGSFCSGINATVSSVGVSHATAPTCSPSQNWEIDVSVTMSSALEPDAEIYYEIALDSAGTSWQFWKRSATLNHTYEHTTGTFFGTDGAGSNVTRYFKCRASVVNKNDPTPQTCSGPVASSQLTRTEPSCTI